MKKIMVKNVFKIIKDPKKKEKSDTLTEEEITSSEMCVPSKQHLYAVYSLSSAYLSFALRLDCFPSYEATLL